MKIRIKLWIEEKLTKYYLRREERFISNHIHVWQDDPERPGYSCRYRCCAVYVNRDFARRAGITNDS